MKHDLENIKEVYYHESCPDGIASAMMFAIGLSSQNLSLHSVKFEAVQYGKPNYENMEAKPGQAFVDITPPKARWEEWKDLDPIVFDHHETNQVVTEGLNGVYRTNEHHCGAMITLEELVPEDHAEFENLKRVATLSMIRDTWKKNHEDWEEACMLALAVRTLKPSTLFESAYESGYHAFQDVIPIGETLYKKDMAKSKAVAKSSYIHPSKDPSIAFFNCSDHLTSDIANIILNEKMADIAVGWSIVGNQGESIRARVSLRSLPGGPAVNKVCEKYGGGGHENAAGFHVENAMKMQPMEVVHMVLNAAREQYEQPEKK